MEELEETKLKKRKRKAENEHNKSLLLSACTDLAYLYVKQGLYEAAISEYRVLVDIHKARNNHIEYAKANRAIGEAYLGLQEFGKALAHQQIYLETASQENNDLEIQRAYATIGHTYLSWYLQSQNDSTANLNAAYKNFMKSLKIAESLTSISKLEKVDMMARLFSNLGLVKESLGDYNNAMDLINRSIAICKQHDIYEQLSRGYISVASLFEKKQEYNEAICHYNLAIDTAKKLTGNVDLMCAALLAKSETLITLGEFHSAKQSLLKAYKLKTPNVQERQTIERNLRVVTSMCYTEDKLVVSSSDNKEMKNLYEKMGDGACELKSFSKAIEYYKLMLQYAEKSCASDKDLSSCYYSLAETYKDNRQYKEAVEYFEKDYELCKDLKDNLNTLSKILDTKEEAGADHTDIKTVYERAFTNCRINKNLKEERRMINRYICYLRRNNHHTDAFYQEQYLNSLDPMSDDGSSSSDNDSQGSGEKLAVGNDINLDNITDQSDESDIENQHDTSNKLVGRRRNKHFTIKKNAKGESQLHTACINGRIPVVSHLLEQGHPVNVRDNSGWLPLHEACNHGYLEIVKLLLDKGAAINDRGGTHCGGVTPLYDAAHNGHLKIVELLLDRGASIIIKTDEGDTPLNILKLYHKNLNFNGEDYVLYQKLVQRMSTAMEKVGYKIDTFDDQQVSKPDKEPVKNTIMKTNSRIFNIEDEDSNLGSTSSSEVSDLDMMSEYQEVMVQLRKKSTVDTTNKSQTNTKRPALVTDENEILNDWLDDDLKNVNTKKRKMNHASSFINPSFRCNKQKTSFSSENEKQSSKVDNDIVSPDNSGGFEQLTSHITPSKTVNRASSSYNKRKSQASLLDAGFSRNHSITPPVLEKQGSSQSPFQRTNSLNSSKPKQIKLTNFSRVKSFVEADSTTQFHNRQPSVVETIQPVPQVSGELMVYVDVKIEGMVFRVPVLLTQVQTNTIGWLAEQAAIKYARKECTKPTLELETTTGALLSDEDPLSLLFPLGAVQAEPVVGRILKLCLPPLVDRYKDVCLHSNTQLNQDLCKTLEEMSVSLKLNDHGYLGKSLAPLCKALNHQTSLLDLDLSGNFLNNECVQKLCLSLPSLVNLTTLNLSGTGLLSNHLADLVKVFQTNSKPILEKLVSLDLSDNFLRNKSLHHLAQITRHVHLKSLNLSNVKLTKNLLEDINDDSVELELKYLENLNLSDNQLDKHGMEFFITSINSHKLRFLNLGRNLSDNEGIIGLLTGNYGGGEMLATLNLSRCSIDDNELYNLLRSAESLTNINLSYNHNLTGISLRRLLEYPKLEEINLIGCDNILRYFEKCEGDNLLQGSDDQGHKSIKMSGTFQDCQKELGVLTHMFKTQFSNCYEEISDHFLSLSSKR